MIILHLMLSLLTIYGYITLLWIVLTFRLVEFFTGVDGGRRAVLSNVSNFGNMVELIRGKIEF